MGLALHDQISLWIGKQQARFVGQVNSVIVTVGWCLRRDRENGKKTWFRNDSKPVMKGWGDGEMTGTFPICRLYIRMWRKAVESDPKTGKVIKRQVRYATIKKCSDDETFLTVKEELREPVWADIQEIMDEVSK